MMDRIEEVIDKVVLETEERFAIIDILPIVIKLKRSEGSYQPTSKEVRLLSKYKPSSALIVFKGIKTYSKERLDEMIEELKNSKRYSSWSTDQLLRVQDPKFASKQPKLSDAFG